MKDYQRTFENMLDDNREKLIIDLREPQEYEREHVEGAINVFWEKFDEFRSRLSMNKPIYMICHKGDTSDVFAKQLTEAGYEAYSIVEGHRGYLRWKLARI